MTDRSFGLLIAYVIPGFSVIWIWGRSTPAVANWLAAIPSTSPSVGGFLYVTVASIAAGLLLSPVRWAFLDRLHHATGVVPPRWTYSSDQASLEAYRLIVDLHYWYYQFYDSALLVLVLLLLVPPNGPVEAPVEAIVTTMAARLAIVAGVMLFFAASRDTLSKCYSRGSSRNDPTDLGHERTDAMTNGGHYGHATPTRLAIAKRLSKVMASLLEIGYRIIRRLDHTSQYSAKKRRRQTRKSRTIHSPAHRVGRISCRHREHGSMKLGPFLWCC